MMLLADFLETASRHWGKPAIQDVRRVLTCRQLVTLAAAIRRVILAETRRPNVGLLLPSTGAFAGCLYGSLWAGRTVVPLNFLLKPGELATIVDDAGLDLILTCEYFEKLASQLPARALCLERIGLRRRYLLARVLPWPRVPAVEDDALAVILYTSGTTGTPRGVCLSHRNLHGNAMACIRHTQMTGEHEFLGVLPLFHSFGLTATLIAPTLLGATVRYHARFQPSDVVHTLANTRTCVFMATPSMYAALAKAKSVTPEVFQRLRLPISGGEPLAPAVFEDYRARLGVTILEGYGLTETSPVVSLNLPEAWRAGTVGRPLPGVELTARDEDGRPLSADRNGELWVRGPNVMRGYYHRPEETAAAVTPDGWLRTGDLGRIDGDGFVRITGRKKDVIIVGGENVLPQEVEAVLEQHPAVAESSVVGAPDRTRGEVVVAFVVLREGHDATPLELREHCRAHLAGYKIPRQVMIEPDLPRGPTGKILKRFLRERLATQPACFATADA